MVSVLEHVKKIFKPDNMEWQPDQAAIDNAKRAGADTWKPPEPTKEQKLLCLERWYYHVKQKQPDLVLAGEELLRLEPSGLTDLELRSWYWGLRQEACRRMQFIANQCYSKRAVQEWQDREGLSRARELFDEGTRESFEEVLKYLSD